jgi:hypothetical protein
MAGPRVKCPRPGAGRHRARIVETEAGRRGGPLGERHASKVACSVQRQHDTQDRKEGVESDQDGSFDQRHRRIILQ